MDWKLSEDQLAELKESFKLFDKDSDNMINIEDLKIVMRSLGYHLSEAELKDMLSEVDSDGTETIDFVEFIAFLARKCKEENKEEEMTEVFALFDKDCDKKISPQDLKLTMVAAGEQISDAEIEDIFKEYAIDKKEYLNYEEFVKFMFAHK